MILDVSSFGKLIRTNALKQVETRHTKIRDLMRMDEAMRAMRRKNTCVYIVDVLCTQY